MPENYSLPLQNINTVRLTVAEQERRQMAPQGCLVNFFPNVIAYCVCITWGTVLKIFLWHARKLFITIAKYEYCMTYGRRAGVP